MNATQWTTLGDFIAYLGREGKCIVEETEKGWYIQWVDRTPETLARKGRLAAMKESEQSQHASHLAFLRKQAAKARRAAEENGGCAAAAVLCMHPVLTPTRPHYPAAPPALWRRRVPPSCAALAMRNWRFPLAGRVASTPPGPPPRGAGAAAHPSLLRSWAGRTRRRRQRTRDGRRSCVARHLAPSDRLRWRRSCRRRRRGSGDGWRWAGPMRRQRQRQQQAQGRRGMGAGAGVGIASSPGSAAGWWSRCSTSASATARCTRRKRWCAVCRTPTWRKSRYSRPRSGSASTRCVPPPTYTHTHRHRYPSPPLASAVGPHSRTGGGGGGRAGGLGDRHSQAGGAGALCARPQARGGGNAARTARGPLLRGRGGRRRRVRR